jgi:NADH-quinone oxidoreductase subunit L
MVSVALCMLFLPLLSALVTLLFLRKNGSFASLLSVCTSGAILIMALSLIFDRNADTLAWDTTWFQLGGWELRFGFLIDAPCRLLLFVVAFVGFLIHVFSLGYMGDDSARPRYFGGLSIFMFSMLGITLADNLIMIFVFWELVGFSSYLLIAHYFKTDESANASRKAFIVNRIGDFGFLIGIILTYWVYGTVNLNELADLADFSPSLATTTLCLLLACGFIGKSAQFPLHVWLPDAMAGPTPVSALIHAATMVAAGVYLLIRIDFLFTEDALGLIAFMGGLMGLYAGFCALVQRDIKKILAYSTLSQLGYMAAAFGMGAPGLALFHLTTHAFFKALMFLGSGSVIYACHHEQDIFKYGGLRKRMPLTAITFLIGVFAISGVNFFSGYFSKDAILLWAYNFNLPVFILLYAGAILTSIYMFRLYFVSFEGESRSEYAQGAKENSILMTGPLILLGILSIFGGYFSIYPIELGSFLRADLSISDALPNHMWMVVLGTIAWVVGLLFSRLTYSRVSNSDPLSKGLPAFFEICQSRLFFDEIYHFFISKIYDPFCRFLEVMELLFVSGLMVRGSAGLAALLSMLSKLCYSGRMHTYVFWFLLGTVGFLIYSSGLINQ